MIRLKYLNQSGTWPSGRPRFYYRPKGGKNTPLPDYPTNDPRFLQAYMKAAGISEPPKVTGSTAKAIDGYLRSVAFQGLAKATKLYMWKHLDDMRAEFGGYPIEKLTAKAIRKDMARLDPHASLKRLKAWRGLCRWAHGAGVLDENVALSVKKPDLPKSDGFEAWTRDDVRAFRRHWRLNTAQRLFFEVLHFTGARVSDAVRMHEGMIGKDGWLRFKQAKTDGAVAIPVRVPAPAWADGQGALKAALEAREVRHLAWIVTAYGKPRSVKAASMWFAEAARKAGVAKSAHGVRKYRAASMKEAGASADARMAWLGHVEEGEAEFYAKTADQKRVIMSG
jgi:integrase